MLHIRHFSTGDINQHRKALFIASIDSGNYSLFPTAFTHILSLFTPYTIWNHSFLLLSLCLLTSLSCICLLCLLFRYVVCLLVCCHVLLVLVCRHRRACFYLSFSLPACLSGVLGERSSLHIKPIHCIIHAHTTRTKKKPNKHWKNKIIPCHLWFSFAHHALIPLLVFAFVLFCYVHTSTIELWRKTFVFFLSSSVLCHYQNFTISTISFNWLRFNQFNHSSNPYRSTSISNSLWRTLQFLSKFLSRLYHVFIYSQLFSVDIVFIK